MLETTSPCTAKDWDRVRLAFGTSLMVDTPLSSLAQNLDGPDWPIRGKAETPAAYLDYDFADVQALLARKGCAGQVGLLISILRDTLAFDDPFGDMVQHSAANAASDNPVTRNLARLELPADFPLDLTALSAGTLEFCRLEGLTSLGELAASAQRMAQNVIVGGDFRKLLNALSARDEKTLAELLPFRPGSRGLHLIECLAQGGGVPAEAARVQRALGHFRTEFAGLRAAGKDEQGLTRQLIVLKNPEAERRVAAILRQAMTEAEDGRSAPPRRRFGLLTRLFRRGTETDAGR